MKTLVVGLGNPVLTDDGVGLHAVAALTDRLPPAADLETTTLCRGGLALMEELVGYERAVIVDAIRTGAPPGTVHVLRLHDLPTQHSASNHDANLATALQFGRQAGVRLPADDDIALIGVEAADVETFGERCTPPVQAAIPAAIDAVLHALNRRGPA